MARKKYTIWTPELIEQVREEYQTIPAEELAEKYGYTLGSFKFALSLHGIRKETGCRCWTKEQLEKLEREYPTTKYPRILAEELGKTLYQVYQKAFQLCIKRQVKGYKCKGLSTL